VDLPVALPPAKGAIARELTGIMTDPQVEMPMVAFHVIQPVRNDDALCRAGKIMIEGLDGLQRMENSISSEYRVKRMRKLLILIFRSGNQTLWSEVKTQNLKPDIYLIFIP
jgi:hypothetical protein